MGQCSGTNPFKSSYDDMANGVDNITSILDDYHKLFTSVQLCCTTSADDVDAESEPNALAAVCDFYSNSAKAAAVGCQLATTTMGSVTMTLVDRIPGFASRAG